MKKSKTAHEACGKETSRIKLVIFLKAGGSKTYYSFHTEDARKEQPQLITIMHRRLLQNLQKGKYNVAIFYCNKTGDEIVRYDYAGRKILPE